MKLRSLLGITIVQLNHNYCMKLRCVPGITIVQLNHNYSYCCYCMKLRSLPGITIVQLNHNYCMKLRSLPGQPLCLSIRILSGPKSVFLLYTLTDKGIGEHPETFHYVCSSSPFSFSSMWLRSF